MIIEILRKVAIIYDAFVKCGRFWQRGETQPT